MNIKSHINIIKPKKSGDDDSGHGTYVAGIVAVIFSTVPDSQFDVNHYGIWEPAEILKKLKLTAAQILCLPLEQQGAGLVWADEAIR